MPPANGCRHLFDGYPIARMFINFRIEKICGATNGIMELLSLARCERRRRSTRSLDDGPVPLICPTCQAAVPQAGGRPLLCMGLFSKF